MQTLWIVLAAVAAVAALAFALETHLRARSEKKFPHPGALVEVGGRRMHVHVTGEGARTIVFLPGLGTASPDVDFLPLTRRLQDYRCVVPEPLGYGWSEDAASARTVENIVEELRAGLNAAGVRPPYILLGHSASWLYARWWACRYPSEVAGLIGEDPSLPEQVDEPEMTKDLPDHGVALGLLKALGALNRFGLGRLLMRFAPTEAVYMTGGDMAQLPLVCAQAARNWLCRAVTDEYRHFKANARRAGEAYPECPVLMFVANGAASCGAMTFKSGFSWVKAHQDEAAKAVRSRCDVLPGGHYLHWMFPDRMAQAVCAFYPPEDLQS